MSIELGENSNIELTDTDRAHALIKEGFTYSESTWKGITDTLDLVYDNSDELITENIANIVRCFLKVYVDKAFTIENENREKGVTLNGLVDDKELQELSEEESILLNTWVDEFLE